MKGYKAFKEGLVCRHFQYEVGKTFKMDDAPAICEKGFHFCKNLVDVYAYYHNASIIAEVEALGDIVQIGTKFATNEIRIIRIVGQEEIDDVINNGIYNSGDKNSGDFNSGNCNSGDKNSGDFNSGNCNSGDFNSGSHNGGDRNSGSYNDGDRNSGDKNSGAYNSGNCNSGHHNSGNYNSGDRNSGNYNSGYCNSGHHNSGSFNSGDYNSGSCNRGHFNSGHYNSGMFNTTQPTMRLFNKDCGITYIEFCNSLDYDLGDLLNRIYFKTIGEEDVERIKALPNFNPDIFLEITGIDIREYEI